MITSCMIQSRYTMFFDVYTETTTRDPDTRQVTAEWNYAETLECQARGVISEGIRTIGSTEDYRSANRGYTEEEWVKLRTPKQLSKQTLVINIRHRGSEDAAWQDDAGEPMVFDVLGSQPIIDPLGRVVEYESTLSRKQDGLEDINYG